MTCLASVDLFVECVIISMLYSGVSSAVSVVRPVNIHPSLDASMYNPGCTSTLLDRKSPSNNRHIDVSSFSVGNESARFSSFRVLCLGGFRSKGD